MNLSKFVKIRASVFISVVCATDLYPGDFLGADCVFNRSANGICSSVRVVGYICTGGGGMVYARTCAGTRVGAAGYLRYQIMLFYCCKIYKLDIIYASTADMAELVDALVSGTSGSNALEVRVFLSAPVLGL